MTHSEKESELNYFLSAALLAVKLPQSSPESVSGWVANMDAQFYLAHITAEDTQYFHTVADFPPNVSARLSQEVRESDNYTKLKEALQGLFTRSEDERFEEILTQFSLAGRPYEALWELQRTAASVGAGKDLVRHKVVATSNHHSSRSPAGPVARPMS